MNLDDFGNKKEQHKKNYIIFLQLKSKLEKRFGKLGLFKALEILTPEKLETIKLRATNKDGLRIKVEIFLDTEEELKLLTKYFPLNPTTMQIKDIKILLEVLREIDVKY